jgi:hypothetical protein
LILSRLINAYRFLLVLINDYQGLWGAEVRWKVAFVGRTGNLYWDTDSFRLLYPFPKQEDAEAQPRASGSWAYQWNSCHVWTTNAMKPTPSSAHAARSDHVRHNL